MRDYETLDQFVSHWGANTPNAIAIKSERDNEEISYGELDALVNKLCNLYADQVSQGTLCAILMDDSIVCHAFLHAIFRLGGITLPLDSELGEFLLENILDHAEPSLIFLAESNRNVEFLTSKSGSKVEVFNSTLVREDSCKEVNFKKRAKADDVAMIAYTSGTTSNSKGVILTHKNLVAAYRSGTENMCKPTVVGCVFRIASLGTIGIHFFFAQYSGATTVLLPRLDLRSLNSFWQRHLENNIDFVYIVPSLVKLLNHFGVTPSEKPKGIIVSAGSFLPPAQQQEFQSKFKACMLNIYGMTESSFAVFFGRQEGGRGTNDIGPARSLKAKVVDENGELVSRGAPGELWYSGEMVSTHGYLRNSDATKESYRGEWLATGDIVVEDEAGNYTITGRKKDIIIRGGFNVYPSEVEDAVLVETSVANVYVMGADDEVMGEEILAYVQTGKGEKVNTAEMIDRVRKRLGVVKSPDRFVFTESEVPLNAAGKVDRKAVLNHFDKA